MAPYNCSLEIKLESTIRIVFFSSGNSRQRVTVVNVCPFCYTVGARNVVYLESHSISTRHSSTNFDVLANRPDCEPCIPAVVSSILFFPWIEYGSIKKILLIC